MKLTKEDIKKYGTKGEQKKLLEADDPFEIPLGDPQDSEDDEMRPLGG